MNTESIVALIRIIAPAVAMVCAALGIYVDVDSIVIVAVLIAAVVMSIYSGWKNNNVTEAAQKAQEFLKELKSKEE